MNKFSFISLIFCLLSLPNAAQVDKEVVEKFNQYKYYNTYEYAYLTTDKKLYYSGETIDIGVAIMNQYLSPSDLSKIVYIDLIHEENNFAEQFIYRLEDGVVNGIINLPLNIPSGNYQVVASTSFMRNHDLEFGGHRVPIYIQNTNEKPEKVVKQILYEKEEKGAGTITNTDLDLEVQQEDSKLRISMINTSATRNNLYLICEGLSGIQLTARVRAKKGKNSLLLPIEQFKGTFQRLILLDENFNIVRILSFFLKGQNVRHSLKKAEDFKRVGYNQTKLFELSAIEDEPALRSSDNSFFRRIYRIYYNIPLSINLENHSFDELISDSLTQSFSIHSYPKWADILNDVKSDNNVSYLPEKNIQLKGKVSIDGTTNGKVIGFHFFKNGLDLTYQLDSTGIFNLDIVLLAGADYFKATLYDENFNPISDNFELMVDKGPSTAYIDDVVYLSENETDPLISKELEFKYVLSTYSDFDDKEVLFWDNMRFDQQNLVSDYVGLEDFEDFIREAVPNVSVVGGSNNRGVEVFNYKNGNFDVPQIVAVDNTVLTITTPLFDIPLNEIESVHTAFSEEKLQQIGTSFTKGIVMIKTRNRDYSIPEKFKDQNTFQRFVGYTVGTSLNATSDLFSKNSKKILGGSLETLNFKDERLINKNLKIEILKADGTYVIYE